MNWPLPKDNEPWRYVDDEGNVLDVMTFDYPNLCYRNRAGDRLARDWAASKKMIEDGAVKPTPKQGKLNL